MSFGGSEQQEFTAQFRYKQQKQESSLVAGAAALDCFVYYQRCGGPGPLSQHSLGVEAGGSELRVGLIYILRRECREFREFRDS